MAADAHHVRELEVGSVLQHVIEVVLLAGVDDGIGEVNIELEGLLVEERSAESSGVNTGATESLCALAHHQLRVSVLLRRVLPFELECIIFGRTQPSVEIKSSICFFKLFVDSAPLVN